MTFPQTQKLSPYFRAGANLVQKFEQLSIQESLDLLNRKEDKRSTDICLNLLEKCRKKKDRILAQHVHTLICDNGMENDIIIGNYIVPILAECGDVIGAELVLNRLTSRNVYSWTSVILGFLKCGNPRYALELYDKMREDGVYANSHTFVIILKIYGCLRDLKKGEEAHFDIIKVGYERDVFVGTALVDMYIKCGSLSYAQEVFDKMSIHNVVSWNALAMGYAQHGSLMRVFDCFNQMVLEHISPDDVTFLCGLKVCSNLRALCDGQRLHEELTKIGFELDGIVGNTLIDMYAKCSAIDEACHVFDKLPNRNVISWNALISGYIEDGSVHEALKYYEKMLINCILPDVVTLLFALRAYHSINAIERIQWTHIEIVKRAYEGDCVVGNTLINVYCKCDFLEEAQKVFDEQSNHNVVSWNVLITGYVESGCDDNALQCFEDMQKVGIVPDVITFVSILKCCTNVINIVKGQELHTYMIQTGLKFDLFLSNALIDMYAKCGLLADAHKIFDELLDRDVVSWTSLFAGYCERVSYAELFTFFDKMKIEGILPDTNMLSCLLKACCNLESLEKGLDLHNEAIQRGFEKEAFLGIAIVDMYAKCDMLLDAKRVCDTLPVRDILSWNALISGYAEFHSVDQIEKCLKQIKIEGLSPDITTFVHVLKTCTKSANAKMGQDMHRKIMTIGVEDNFMIRCSLAEMYVKCTLIADAQKVSEDLAPAAKNTLWTSMLTGFKEDESTEQILGFVQQQMQLQDIFQNKANFACIFKAYCVTKDIVKSQELHTEIVSRGFEKDLLIGSALVHMYAKCDSLIDAREIFRKLSVRDVVSWNIIIAGYIEECAFREALDRALEMQDVGIPPNLVTFIYTVRACGSMGLVEKGNQIYIDVVCKGFDNDLFVGNTVIDMYAKCGLVGEAQEVFAKLSVRDTASWNSMIAGYGINHDIRRAVQVFENMQDDKRVMPDATTFICLLSACSRGSLVNEGHKYFRMMAEVYGIVPMTNHWNCIVDLLARAGDIYEAMKFIGLITSSSSPSRDMLTALLTACRTCAKIDLGLKCFKQLAQVKIGRRMLDTIH